MMRGQDRPDAFELTKLTKCTIKCHSEKIVSNFKEQNEVKSLNKKKKIFCTVYNTTMKKMSR